MITTDDDLYNDADDESYDLTGDYDATDIAELHEDKDAPHIYPYKTLLLSKTPTLILEYLLS